MSHSRASRFTAAAIVGAAAIVATSFVPAAATAESPAVASPAFSLERFTLAPDEDPVSRTEVSNTYDAGDGVMVTEVSSTPINIETADGEWVPINSSVSPDGDGGFSAEGTPLEPVFAEDAGSKMLTVTDGTYTLAFGLLGAAESNAELESSSESESVVTYEEATASGEDIEYRVSANSVKETIVLAESPTAGSPSWTWNVQAPGLTLKRDDHGDLKFVDAQGKTRFTVPAPRMWDSSGEEGVREPQETAVETSFSSTGAGGWHLKLTADGGWLRGADRVYPVYVDPTTSLGDTSVVSYKSDGATRTDAVHVGNSRDGNTNKYWRARVNRPGFRSLFYWRMDHAPSVSAGVPAACVEVA